MSENPPNETLRDETPPKRRDSRSQSSDYRISPVTDSQKSEPRGEIDEENDSDVESNVSGTGRKDRLQNAQLNNSPTSVKSRSIRLEEKSEQIIDNHAGKPTPTSPKAPTPGVEEDLTEQADGASPEKEKVSSTNHPTWKYPLVYGTIIALLMAAGGHWCRSNGNTSLSSPAKIKQDNWRDYIDSDRKLPPMILSNIRAALKPVSASALKESTVATLIILSEDEEKAAELGRCLLSIVNEQSKRDGLIPEVDFRNDHWTKLKIDEHLQAILKPDETILGVLIRNIDHLASEHALERARLLFSYCDGENPKIPHRLIIMTATVGEELRKRFAAAWTKESDFIDPLMARINGTTIIIDRDQKSIC